MNSVCQRSYRNTSVSSSLFSLSNHIRQLFLSFFFSLYHQLSNSIVNINTTFTNLSSHQHHHLHDFLLLSKTSINTNTTITDSPTSIPHTNTTAFDVFSSFHKLQSHPTPLSLPFSPPSPTSPHTNTTFIIVIIVTTVLTSFSTSPLSPT